MVIILIISIFFQLSAVLIAVKLVKITERFFPWVLVAIAMLEMAIRRIVTLIYILKETSVVSGVTKGEYETLAVSILLSVGLFFMIPLFKSIKTHEKELEKKNTLLIKSNKIITKNENKFKTFWELSFEGVLIHKKGIALETNLSFLNMFGYKEKELIGKNIIKLLILKKYHKNIFNNITKDYVFPYFVEGKRKDGTIFPIEIEARDFISENNKVLRIVAFRDITERKTIEAENRNLSSLIEQSANTIMITDSEGRIEYTNQSFTNTTGYTADEVLGKQLSMLKSGLHHKKFYTHLWKTINSGKIWRGEFRNKNKKGKLFWEKATITPIKNEEGKIINFLSIREDVTALKKAKEKLILSNAKFKNIVENTSEWILELDEKGFITYSNSIVELFFGYKREELLGRNMISLITKSERMRVAEQFLKSVKQKKGWRNLEMSFIHKNGKINYLESSVVPIINKKGILQGFRGINRDITERIKAESELKQLNIAINNSVNEVFVFDAVTLKFTYVNNGALNNLGYTLEEIKNLTPVEIKPEYTVKKFIAILTPLIESTVNKLQFRTVHQRKDKTTYPVEVNLSKFIVNKREYFLAIVIDITDRAKSELALKKSEEKFRTFSDSAKVAIFVIKDKKFWYVNNECSELLEFTKEELKEKTFVEVLHPDDMQFVSNNYQKRLDGKKFLSRYEIRIITKSGTVKTLDTNVALIEFDNEQTVLISCIDITKTKEMTYKIEESLGLLKSKNKELEQFAFIASHDLQEPLTTVSSFVELLNEEYREKLDNNANTYLNFISESTNRMKNLITGLLEYSRIGRTRTLEKVNCNEILETVKKDLKVTIDKKGAVVESEQLPDLLANPIEIKQLFQNLVSNALKYSKKDAPLLLNISAQKRDNTWLFKFKDNGIGIDDKYYEKIFVIFQRLHNKDDYEGTGIGLAYCRKIVELHNGKIWVESTLNEGSEFSFTINTNGL